MNIIHRRIIAYTLILAFLILTPILLLYTSGYRYDFKKTSLQKTGVLVLETKPTGANVYLNNEINKYRTPARLNNVLTNEYLIKAEKTNYYPWQKKLTVKSQETTFAEDLVLFSNSKPKKLLDEKITWWDFSANNKFASFIISETDQDYLYLLDLNNGKTRLIYNDNNNFLNPEIFWSKEDSYLTFKTEKQSKVISTSLPKQTFDLTKNKTSNLKNLKWDTNNFNLVYFQIDNSIYKKDILINSQELILTLPKQEIINDFFIHNNEVFVIETLSNKTALTKFPINKTQLAFIPNSIELKQANYKLIDNLNGFLAFEKVDDHTFYLINENLDKISFNKQGVKNYDFLTKNKLLLLNTEQELTYLDLTQSDLKEKTITRYSQGLQNALWHESANYSLTLQDNKINIIELDNRNGNFTINLPFENIADFSIDTNSENLYFVKENWLWQKNLK